MRGRIVLVSIKWLLSFLVYLLNVILIYGQPGAGSESINSESTESLTERDSINIGYGFLNKREITSAIGSMNFEEFNKGNINNPLQLIAAKMAGLSVSKPGSDPNGLYDIRLRGLNTIFGNTRPVVIIDGVIDASVENVDPDDIESIIVLKDGSAAIYGTRGSGGVILVTTKRGEKGTSIINYNVYTTAEMVARNNPAMNAKEWRALSAEAGLGMDFGTSTDWFKEIEQTAISMVHNISMSGGTDMTSYRASINYRTGNGVLVNSGYNQLNGRINITQKALNDKFTLDMNMGATQRESRYGFAEAFRYASIYNPTSPVKSSDPAYSNYDGYFQQVLFDYYNPVSILGLNKNEGQNRILNMSLKGTYEILKVLSMDAFYSVQSIGALAGEYFDKNDYWGGMNRNGLASRQQDNSVSRLFESTAYYNDDMTSAVNLSLMGGYSYQDFTNEGFYAQGGDFLTDEFSFNNLGASLDFKNGKGTITSYKNSNRLIAFFGRVNLNINNLWFLSSSARYEGSSRFGSSHKWGLFPALGSGIDLSELLRSACIDNLKLRMNYGITGNQPAESYLSLQRLGHQSSYYHDAPYSYYNGEFIPLYTVVNNANPDLKREKTGKFDTGLDFSFFKSRLNGSFDVYFETASDLLFRFQVPVPPNLYNLIWLNLGKLRSSGLELTLNYNVIKKSDLSYMISLASTSVKTRLISLSGTFNGAVLKYGIQDIGDMGIPGGSGIPLIRVEEGKPVGQLLAYKFKGIDETGKFIFEDANNDGIIDYRDNIIAGNGLPKCLIGIGNIFHYRNWDLNIFFRAVLGHDLINSYRALYESPVLISRYNLPETAADLRIPVTHALYNGWAIRSSKEIENASFFSLDNMSLGYTFKYPENSQFSKIRLSFACNNLFYLTRYKGSDPNPRYVDSKKNYGTYNYPLAPGIDRLETWPRTRSVTFGANVVF